MLKIGESNLVARVRRLLFLLLAAGSGFLVRRFVRTLCARRLAHMSLIDERLQRNGCGSRAGSGRDPARGRSARDRIPIPNAGRDFVGEFLPVVRALRVIGFRRISQEPAFDQDRGNAGSS